IFVGYQPPRPQFAEVESDPIEDIIPQTVRLSHTDPDVGEAWLRTLIFQKPEMRVGSKRGFDAIRITNEDSSKTLIKATVLRVDQRDMYFQVKEDVYGIHIGQTMAQAMKRPLFQKELEELNLISLIKDYDPKSDPTNTKKTTKGRAGAGVFQGK